MGVCKGNIAGGCTPTVCVCVSARLPPYPRPAHYLLAHVHFFRSQRLNSERATLAGYRMLPNVRMEACAIDLLGPRLGPRTPYNYVIPSSRLTSDTC